MTKKLVYKRTQEAITLFRSFFDSDEDYLAFHLKYKIKTTNHKFHASISVHDENDKLQSFEGIPSFVTFNSARWQESKCRSPWMMLDISDQAQCYKLDIFCGKNEEQKRGIAGLAKQLGRQLKVVNRL